eukprot:gene1172-690_t
MHYLEVGERDEGWWRGLFRSVEKRHRKASSRCCLDIYIYIYIYGITHACERYNWNQEGFAWAVSSLSVAEDLEVYNPREGVNFDSDVSFVIYKKKDREHTDIYIYIYIRARERIEEAAVVIAKAVHSLARGPGTPQEASILLSTTLRALLDPAVYTDPLVQLLLADHHHQREGEGEGGEADEVGGAALRLRLRLGVDTAPAVSVSSSSSDVVPGGLWLWEGFRAALQGHNIHYNLRGTGLTWSEDFLTAQEGLRREPPRPSSLSHAVCRHLSTAKIDVLMSIVCAVLGHVVQQPLLEAGQGPLALFLCPTQDTCDEVARAMIPLAERFHLLVHNVWDPLPPATLRLLQHLGTTSPATTTAPDVIGTAGAKVAEIVIATPPLWEQLVGQRSGYAAGRTYRTLGGAPPFSPSYRALAQRQGRRNNSDSGHCLSSSRTEDVGAREHGAGHTPEGEKRAAPDAAALWLAAERDKEELLDDLLCVLERLSQRCSAARHPQHQQQPGRSSSTVVSPPPPPPSSFLDVWSARGNTTPPLPHPQIGRWGSPARTCARTRIMHVPYRRTPYSAYVRPYQLTYVAQLAVLDVEQHVAMGFGPYLERLLLSRPQQGPLMRTASPSSSSSTPEAPWRGQKRPRHDPLHEDGPIAESAVECAARDLLDWLPGDTQLYTVTGASDVHPPLIPVENAVDAHTRGARSPSSPSTQHDTASTGTIHASEPPVAETSAHVADDETVLIQDELRRLTPKLHGRMGDASPFGTVTIAAGHGLQHLSHQLLGTHHSSLASSCSAAGRAAVTAEQPTFVDAQGLLLRGGFTPASLQLDPTVWDDLTAAVRDEAERFWAHFEGENVAESARKGPSACCEVRLAVLGAATPTHTSVADSLLHSVGLLLLPRSLSRAAEVGPQPCPDPDLLLRWDLLLDRVGERLAGAVFDGHVLRVERVDCIGRSPPPAPAAGLPHRSAIPPTATAAWRYDPAATGAATLEDLLVGAILFPQATPATADPPLVAYLSPRLDAPHGEPSSSSSSSSCTTTAAAAAAPAAGCSCTSLPSSLRGDRSNESATAASTEEDPYEDCMRRRLGAYASMAKCMLNFLSRCAEERPTAGAAAHQRKEMADEEEVLYDIPYTALALSNMYVEAAAGCRGQHAEHSPLAMALRALPLSRSPDTRSVVAIRSLAPGVCKETYAGLRRLPTTTTTTAQGPAVAVVPSPALCVCLEQATKLGRVLSYYLYEDRRPPRSSCPTEGQEGEGQEAGHAVTMSSSGNPCQYCLYPPHYRHSAIPAPTPTGSPAPATTATDAASTTTTPRHGNALDFDFTLTLFIEFERSEAAAEAVRLFTRQFEEAQQQMVRMQATCEAAVRSCVHPTVHLFPTQTYYQGVINEERRLRQLAAAQCSDSPQNDGRRSLSGEVERLLDSDAEEEDAEEFFMTVSLLAAPPAT